MSETSRPMTQNERNARTDGLGPYLVGTRAPYGWRDCPTCRGTGINPMLLTRVCPRCGGERRVPNGS
jgi:hypothetical protein